MPPLLDTKKGEAGTINRNTGQFVDPYKPAPSAPVISAQGLKDTPQPMYVPPPQPTTQSTALGGLLEANSNSFLAGLDRQAAESKEARDNSLELVLRSMASSDGEIGLTDKLYQDTGVDKAGDELRDINDQILAEQHALRRRIEAIQRNENGASWGGLDDMINEAERESLGKQADLAIIQLSKQGKYDSARAIADRAVQAMMEKQKQRNDILRFVYEQNKEQFTSDEKRAFETAQADRNRILDLQVFKERARFEMTLKQADPLYQANLKEAQAKLAQSTGIATATPTQLAKQQSSIIDVGSLVTNPALNGAVGPNPFARLAPIQGLTGAKQNFIGSVEQLRSQLNLDALIQAKAQGATFGALSDQELKILASSASKIGTWAMKDKDGNITGYNASEQDFKNELTRINNFAKLDYVLKGGDPSSVGVQQMKDGTLWTQNSDGSYTQLQ